MSKLYSIDIQVWATAYIIADSAEEAREISETLTKTGIEVDDGQVGEDGLEIYGGVYHPDMPAVSLSPTMTLYGPEAGTVPELIEEFA